MIRSLDTETTGLDLYKGCKPFYVVSSDEKGNVSYWEWEVDQRTRQPIIPESDVSEIKSLLGIGIDPGNDTETARDSRIDPACIDIGSIDPGIETVSPIVLQNAKFDIAALSTLDPSFSTQWPYHRTFDTILAAHLLASNRPKDLATLSVQYLGIDIQPLEDRLHNACEQARREARKLMRRGEKWNIAAKDNPLMPSAKQKCWKYDTWLPRAMARRLEHKPSHHWWTVLQDYANADAEITVALYPVMLEQIRKRKLDKIFAERLKVIPIAHSMEERGVTISYEKLNTLHDKYGHESRRSESICVNIAQGMGHSLTMPKGNTPNNSLKKFIYEVMKLEPRKSKKSKGANASLDSEVLQHYIDTLPHRSVQQRFVKEMLDKRTRDTALVYMEGYTRFWNKIDDTADWFILHPSLNPTGTDTLRWSSQNPNEQNISKRKGFNLRYCFGPAPGREWWSIDAKNIELRLPAYEANETEMIALFERENDPPYYGSNHMLVFHLLWPELWDKAVKEVGIDKAGPHCKKLYASTYYQWVKNGNFAVQYGAIERQDGWGTADVSYHQQYSHRKVKSKFPNIAKLNDRCIKFAEVHGYIETIPDRSIDPDRGYPLLCTRTDYGKILPTVPLNYRIQGSACHWMMKGMIRTEEYLNQLNKEETWGRDTAFIVMQIHDELVISIPSRGHPVNDPDNSNLKYVKEIVRLMEIGGIGDYGIPVPCGIEFHSDNWSEGITL